MGNEDSRFADYSSHSEGGSAESSRGKIEDDPVVKCLQSGAYEELKSLLGALEEELGASRAAEEINRGDSDGNTYMHSACALGQLECAQLLFRFGASVKASDKSGVTPLHDAAYHGNIQIVKWLVESAGADASAFDNDGERPVDYASQAGKMDIVAWLDSNAVPQVMTEVDVKPESVQKTNYVAAVKETVEAAESHEGDEEREDVLSDPGEPKLETEKENEKKAGVVTQAAQGALVTASIPPEKPQSEPKASPTPLRLMQPTGSSTSSADVRRLEQQLHAANAHHASELRTFKSEIAALRRKLEAAQVECDSLARQVRDRDADLRGCKEEVMEVRRHCQAAEAERDSLIRKTRDREAELRSCKEEIGDLKRDRDAAEAERDTLARQMRDRKAELRVCEEEIDRLTADNGNLERTRERLRDEVVRVRTEYDGQAEKLRDDTLSKVEALRRDFFERLHDAEENAKARASKEIIRITAREDALRLDHEKLQGRLNDAQRMLQEKASDLDILAREHRLHFQLEVQRRKAAEELARRLSAPNPHARAELGRTRSGSTPSRGGEAEEERGEDRYDEMSWAEQWILRDVDPLDDADDVALWNGTEIAVVPREDITPSFVREAALLSHPRIVQFLGVLPRDGNDDDGSEIIAHAACYEALPLSAARLAELVENDGGALSCREIVDLSFGVLLGLSHLHARVPPRAHGDLSLSSVMLTDALHVKLRAPRPFLGGDAALAEDIFAFGVLLAELATGRPWRGEASLASSIALLPLKDLAVACLSTDAGARPSCQDAVAMLAGAFFADENSEGAKSYNEAPPTRRVVHTEDGLELVE